MKLKDLLKWRDKLRKYDEMKQLRTLLSVHDYHDEKYGDVKFRHVIETNTCCSRHCMELSDEMRFFILDALDAEIKKMEEE